ncbi:MAG: hypothetical protein CVU24_00640 [Betaproteobacteria bacterium HGW-Betaproteobacteria-18]|nr:MAG: hypothetical protein CVU24_00640 [Betaproteobacteria bacterium HGW-Betaproteobacteria-18]
MTIPNYVNEGAMGSFGFLHVIFLIAGGAVAYYFLFRPDVHLIMPNELKDIEKNVKDLIEADPMDYNLIAETKEKLRGEFVQCAHMFNRNPPGFSKEEATSLRAMVDESKQTLRSVCKLMEEVKGPLEKVLRAAEVAAEKIRAAIELRKKDSSGDNDELEDELDDFEAMLESMIADVLKHTESKKKLEYSLAKYGSL